MSATVLARILMAAISSRILNPVTLRAQRGVASEQAECRRTQARSWTQFCNPRLSSQLTGYSSARAVVNLATPFTVRDECSETSAFAPTLLVWCEPGESLRTVSLVGMQAAAVVGTHTLDGTGAGSDSGAGGDEPPEGGLGQRGGVAGGAALGVVGPLG